MIARLWCWIVGHDVFRFSIGENWIDVCLRCRERLAMHEAGS